MIIDENGQNIKRMSEIFSIIKIPFFIFIVFIHNSNSTTSLEGVELGLYTNVPIYYYTSQYISEVISRIAVPGFFLISGYLFFFNTKFNKTNYLKKIKRRIRSLLVPYLFWNFLFMVYYFLLPVFVPSLFQEEGHEITMNNILCSLWVFRDGHALNQYWYLRDLMVCAVISPVYCCLFMRNGLLKFFSITVLFCLWFFDLEIPFVGPYGFSVVGLFFFGLGAFLAMNKLVFTDYVKNSLSLLLALIFSLADLLIVNGCYHYLYHNLFIVFGLMACFYIVGFLYDKNDKRIINSTKLLSSASFFVYAVHLPWVIIPLRKILFNVINPITDMSLLLLYFIIVIVTISVSILFYSFLAKFFPRFTMVITGGRLYEK